MSLVRSVVSIVKEEAEAAGAAKVNRVHIVLGEGRDIPDHVTAHALMTWLIRH